MLLTQGHLHEYRDNLITHTNVRDNGEREEKKEKKTIAYEPYFSSIQRKTT